MQNTINCKGKLIDLSEPKIMGILNLTPDSFYDGGKNNSIENALAQTKKMLDEGADFIDIGAISSRPGAKYISNQEELDRLCPIIEAVLKHFPNTLLSIDTFRASVAKESITLGAAIINDISGGNMDNKMFETIAKLKCPYILMHMRGVSENMQSLCQYKQVTRDVIQELSEKINTLIELNVSDIIVDPGFGFSKTLEQNYTMMNELELFNIVLERPVLIGISRKSMIWKALQSNPDKALNGTSILNTVGLQKGAKILRVHDVKEAKEVLTLYKFLKQS